VPRHDAVFFDLDGTLLDTAPDLADACNFVLKKYQKKAVDFSKFRNWVHGGAKLMICQSFQIQPDNSDYETIKLEFLTCYQQILTQKTQLFPGINKVLDYLEANKIPWGVVTNKHQRLTLPLLDHFLLSSRCCCIVSGDTLPQTKPDPAPLLHACQLISVRPDYSLYIGDTLSDIQAAKSAGMRSIAVSYGYHPHLSSIETWPADAWAATTQDLLDLLALER